MCRFSTLTRGFTALFLAVMVCVPAAAAAQDSTDDAEDTELAETLAAEDSQALQDLSSRLRSEIRGLAGSQARNRPLEVNEALRLVSHPRAAGDIFRWMRDNIQFEPYAGSLRGAEGTLVARAANSVDQALLAAAILEEAGVEYRFVNGRLHGDDAEQILRYSLGSVELFSGTDLTTRSFSSTTNSPRNLATQSMQDHVWLEVLVRDEYHPFDPIAAPLFGMTPATPTNRHDALPSQYRTTMEIILVSHLNDGQRVENITVKGPLPTYAYRSLSLSFEDDSTRRRGHRPILTIDGTSSRGQSIPVASLEELEIRYNMRMGSRETRWQQTLFERDQGTDIFDFDHQHFSIAIIPGWTSLDQVRSLTATATGDALDSFDEWLRQERETPNEGQTHRQHTNDVLELLGTTLSFSFAYLLDRTTTEIAEHFGIAPVLTSPRVITTGILRRGKNFLVDLQLHGDRIDALPRAGVPAIAGPAFLGMHGRIRDQLVGELFEVYGSGGGATVDQIFRRAAAQSVPFTTIDGSSLDRLDRADIDEVTKKTIARQIRRQSLVVLTPLRAVEDEGITRHGWWALDPISGALEAHTSDALLTLAEENSTGDITVEELLRGHLGLVARQFSAAEQATADDTRFPSLTCSASRQLVRLGRAYCATTAALPRSNLDACLDNPPVAGGNLFTMGNLECSDRTAAFRCSSVYADAIVNGQLFVASPGTTPQSPPEALCR